MRNDKKQNLQDTFLNSVRKTKTPLTIFLVNGVKLQGVVTWFDNFCVLLRRDGQSQLVYKHAISTIMPAQPVQLYEPARRRGRLSASKSVDREAPRPGRPRHPSRPRGPRAPRAIPRRGWRRPSAWPQALDLEVARDAWSRPCASHARHPVRQGQGRGARRPGARPPRPTSWSSTTP